MPEKLTVVYFALEKVAPCKERIVPYPYDQQKLPYKGRAVMVLLYFSTFRPASV
jgi:hypothetical protein